MSVQILTGDCIERMRGLDDMAEGVLNTLATLAAKANARGFRVNNLFQLDDGNWQANLRSDANEHAYGIAGSPESALGTALEEMDRRYPAAAVSPKPKADFLA